MKDRSDWLSGDMPEVVSDESIRPSVRRAQPYEWPGYQAERRLPARPIPPSALPPQQEATQPMRLQEAQTTWINEAQNIQAEALTAREKKLNAREDDLIKSVRFDMTLTTLLAFGIEVFFVLNAVYSAGVGTFALMGVWGLGTILLIHRTVVVWRHKLPLERP